MCICIEIVNNIPRPKIIRYCCLQLQSEFWPNIYEGILSILAFNVADIGYLKINAIVLLTSTTAITGFSNHCSYICQLQI